MYPPFKQHIIRCYMVGIHCNSSKIYCIFLNNSFCGIFICINLSIFLTHFIPPLKSKIYIILWDSQGLYTQLYIHLLPNIPPPALYIYNFSCITSRNRMYNRKADYQHLASKKKKKIEEESPTKVCNPKKNSVKSSSQ